MKTSSGLALAAALAVAAGAAYTGLPAAATQPPPGMPALPPVVLDPGIRLPAPAPADMQPPVPPPLPVPKAELPPLPPVVPLPPPTVPPPVKAAPMAIPLPPPPAAKLPAVPPPPLANPLPLPAPALPVVPPPTALTPPTPLPAVPPPTAAPLPAPRAENPQPLPPPTPLTQPTPPSVGSVVVLQDGKIVEGHVSRTSDKVVVRRGAIDQPFPVEQVKYVAKDKDEAYRLALKDTKTDDPAARLRLGRWCMYNGMRENALTEAKETLRLEPANRTAAELARTLEESLRLYPGDGTTRATPPKPVVPGLPAVPPPAVVPVVVVPEPDIAPEAVVAYGPRVQPVLMNQCASCHAKAEYTGAFKLVPVASNETNPAATRQNLRAAAAQIKKSEPGASPLLLKALAAHGGMLAPAFADREAMPFRILQAWAYLAVGELTPPVAAAPLPVPAPAPTLPSPPRPEAPTAGPMLPPPPLVLPPPPALPTVPVPLPAVPAPLPIPPAVDSIPPIPPAAARLPAIPPVVIPAGGFGQSAPPPATPTGPVNDEFDPARFNRPSARR